MTSVALFDGLIGWLDARFGVGWGPGVAAVAYMTVVAFLVGRFAPERRKFLRIGVIFFLLHLCCVSVAAVFSLAGAGDWSERARSVGVFFLQAQYIHLTALSVFFLVLPRAKLDVPDILRDLVIGVAYFIALMAMLRRFGVEVWSLFATSAVASIVVGVSLQPTLASIFGGVTMQIDGSIGEGDWVRLPDKQEGKVKEVRWRHTVLETRNGDTLIVPNAQLLQQQILVLGRREGHRIQHRMWVYFQVDLRTSPEHVIEVVGGALGEAVIEGVSTSPRPDCICLGLGGGASPSANQYAVRYWLLDLSRDDPTSSLVMVRVHAALDRAGLSLALPFQRVGLAKEGAKARLARRGAEVRRRVELLRRIELFEKMLPSELEALASKLRPAPFCKGEVISRQGAEAHWLYILASGSAESRTRLPGGNELPGGELVAPDVFGEFSLLTGAPRRATVVATSRVECLRLDRSDFAELIASRPEITEELSRKLAERQRAFEQALAAVGEPAAPDPEDTQGRMLRAMQRFFGLEDEPPASRSSRA